MGRGGGRVQRRQRAQAFAESMLAMPTIGPEGEAGLREGCVARSSARGGGLWQQPYRALSAAVRCGHQCRRHRWSHCAEGFQCFRLQRRDSMACGCTRMLGAIRGSSAAAGVESAARGSRPDAEGSGSTAHC